MTIEMTFLFEKALFICSSPLQTVAMCGGAFFMVLINKSESSGQAMLCMMLSISCNALGNAGVLVLPQDMSPKFAGTLFGN